MLGAHINCFVEGLSSLTAKWSEHTVCSVSPLQVRPSAAQSPSACARSFSAPNAFATSQFPHPCSRAGGAAPGRGSHARYVHSTRTPSPTAQCSHHNQCLCFCLPPALVVSDAVLCLISVRSEMFRIFASCPSAHHSFLLTPSRALLSHSSHYATASTLARFRPLPAAPTLQDSVSDSFFFSWQHFCPGRQHSGSSAHVQGYSSTHLPAIPPWRLAELMNSMCQVPGNSFSFILIPNDAQTVLIQSQWAPASGSSSYDLLFAFGCYCICSSK